MKARGTVLGLLSLAIMLSALAVVYAKHESRKLFVEWQGLLTKQDEMNIEWGQLQLEQSTWATHPRVESLARKRLGMILPAQNTVEIIRP